MFEISFTGFLTLIFITLKLLNVIDWSWIWVLCPMWISAVLALVVIFIAGVVYTWKQMRK